MNINELYEQFVFTERCEPVALVLASDLLDSVGQCTLPLPILVSFGLPPGKFFFVGGRNAWLEADAPAADEEEIEHVFQTFWRAIVMPAGHWDLQQVKRELFDYWCVLQEVRQVYAHVTGGRISKQNTVASAVIEAADEHYAWLSAEE